MKEMTSRDLIRALFPIGESAQGLELAAKVGALTTIVLDLLAEVEALRLARGTKSDYRSAYRSTCLLTHNSAGVSTGWEKLIACYYPREQSSDGRVWRESAMMERLGFTDDEIADYQKEAQGAEYNT